MQIRNSLNIKESIIFTILFEGNPTNQETLTYGGSEGPPFSMRKGFPYIFNKLINEDILQAFLKCQ